MESLWADIRFGLRMLRRTPGVAAAAVIALGLGVGANTAIFSVVDGVLLRPLPYPGSESLVVITGKFPVQEMSKVPLSGPEVKDVAAMSTLLESVGAFAQGDANLTGAGVPPDRVAVGVANASFFPTLGVQPILGRNFTVEEEVKGNDQVALLDYAMWQRRFGGAEDAIGKELMLDHQPYRVIGVLPEGFGIEQHCDLWTPLSTSIDMLTVRGAHFLRTIGRMKAGATLPEVRAELDAVGQRMLETYAGSYKSFGLDATPMIEEVVGDVRAALLVLLGAVAFVLLIACANVANLLLARAAARHRELAIRTALGAGRRRLVRQLLTESVMLALLGGGVGLLFAVWGVDAMVALSPDALPRTSEIALDARVLAFTVVVALGTGLAFGLVPALSASRLDLHEALKDGTRGTTSGRGRLRRALVISEVALSMVLLVGAGLMVRSFLQLRAVDPGIRADGVLTLRVSLPTPNGMSDDTERRIRAAWFARAEARLAALPGVEAIGCSNLLPFDGDSQDNSFDIEGYVAPNGATPDNEVREVTPGYFRAMGMTLLSGRFLEESDGADAPPVVVINQAMARRYWPDGTDPLGKHLRIRSSRAPQKEWSTIVGVTGDVHSFGLDKPARAEMYFSYAQLRRSPSMAIVLRVASSGSGVGSGDPAELIPSVRAAMNEVDPGQPIFNIKPMTELIAASLAQRRFSMVLMLIFAGVALLLAAVGIYGVMSYTVAQRSQEIGIRVALGATPAGVLRMVVRDGMLLTAIGLGAGSAAALGLTRLASSLFYGVSAADLGTYGAIALVLAAVALVATVIPAQRATRIDPMLALRAE